MMLVKCTDVRPSGERRILFIQCYLVPMIVNIVKLVEIMDVRPDSVESSSKVINIQVTLRLVLVKNKRF